MTVRINKNALNLREELTKAQSVVPYVQQQFWMDGLVENGTFDTTDGWTLGTGWSISGGVASCNGTQTSNSGINQTLPIEAGKTYLIVFDLVVSAGAITWVALGGGIDNTNITSSGSYAVTLTTTTTASLSLAADANFVGNIDNVKVFEVDENDNVIHSLPLGWKPLHVYEDGLIQREGDVHDYTVVKTGGAYAIKPAVQPTATTEPCVIAEREL